MSENSFRGLNSLSPKNSLSHAELPQSRSACQLPQGGSLGNAGRPKPPSLREVDFAKQKTEGVRNSLSFAELPQSHLRRASSLTEGALGEQEEQSLPH